MQARAISRHRAASIHIEPVIVSALLTRESTVLTKLKELAAGLDSGLMGQSLYCLPTRPKLDGIPCTFGGHPRGSTRVRVSFHAAPVP